MKKVLFFLVILLHAVVAVKAQIITTIAGNGSSGFSGDGGLATNARINHPQFPASDAFGNVYFADHFNCRVRRISKQGVINTVAGNGTCGFSGDGGPASAANISRVSCVAIDKLGNLYIGDVDNNRIRKIDTFGIIRTIAGNGSSSGGDGGAATSAGFHSPVDLALDRTGNIFVSDHGGHRIRKIDTFGIISTIAGNGAAGFSGDGGAASSAQLNYPTGIDVDTSGNIYIADYLNSRIRKVNTSGVITTVAGTGSLGYSGNGGAATAASLYWPTGVVVDFAGNLLIADAENHVVRKVNNVGIISTIAGTGGDGFSGDGGAATAAVFRRVEGLSIGLLGNLVVTDPYNARIRSISNVAVVPITISGTTTVCAGSVTSLAGTPSGGIWSSSNTSVATVGSSSGVGNGVAAGTSVISYSVVGSSVTTTVTVNPLPSAGTIFGTTSLTTGSTASLSSTAAGGSWSSSNTAVATMGTAGIVSGVSAGSTVISYSVSNSCATAVAVHTVTVSSGSSGGCVPIITTIAGNGSNTHSGDGGQATAAGMNPGNQIAIDRLGNIYLSDYCCRIRKIDTFGVITTIAGSGSTGFSGDGGQATAARLNMPIGVACDTSGNIYIADRQNFRVRKINSSGVITTVAGSGSVGYSGDGSPATAATFSNMTSVHADLFGNIYITDDNHVVRKINSTGIISTVAGIGGSGGFSGDGGPATAARLTYPLCTVVDDSGVIYVADAGNNRIRKISTSGIITTIAGSGTTGFSGDGGAASAAAFNNLSRIALDGSMNLYVVDGSNNRIRKINAIGTISTVVGSGTATFGGDNGPATAAGLIPTDLKFDRNGNIFIVDAHTRLRKVNSTFPPFAGTISGTPTLTSGSTAALTTTATGGTWSSSNTSVATIGTAGIVSGVSAGSTTISYSVSNSCGTAVAMHTVAVVSGSSPCVPIITTIAGTGTAGYSGDGGAATAARLNNTQNLAIDRHGNILLADVVNNRIRKIDTSGRISTIAGNGSRSFGGDGGPATAASLNYPRGIAIDTIGNIYIADDDNQRIRKINTSGIINTIAGTGSIGSTGDGGQATAATFHYPENITLDLWGNLYITEAWGHRVRKINTSGIISTVVGTGVGGYTGDGGQATSARILYPQKVAVDAIGNIYLADANNNRVRKINSSGIITTIAGIGTAGFSGDGGPATAAQLNNPVSIAIDNSGEIHFSDGSNNRIRKISTSGIISTIAGAGTGSYGGDGGSATIATINNPQGIIFSNSGSMLIADYGNHAVRRIEPVLHAIAGSTSLCAGSSTTLSNSYVGGTWSSSNSSIASIGSSSGIIHGISTGTSLITYALGGCSASTVVTVNPIPVITGAGGLCLAYSTSLSSNISGGIWSSSSMAMVSIGSISGVVVGAGLGTSTVTYQLNTGCSTTGTVSVNICAPTPCSEKIYFSSPTSTSSISNIWTMDTSGAGRRPLFSDSYYRQSLAVSNDGTMLAYGKRKNPSGCSGGDSLWVCTSDNLGQNEQIHYLLSDYSTKEIRNLSINSTKSKVIFNTFDCGARDGDIFSLDLSTHVLVQLTSNTDTPKFAPSYSPDNSKIAYTQLGTPWYAFPCPGRIMNSDGSGSVNFTPAGGGNYHHLKYSPDGSMLVFTHFPSLGTPYTLYLVSPSGSGLLSLGVTSTAEMQPTFNPISNEVAFVDASNNLKFVNVSGTVLRTIPPSSNTTFNDINWVRTASTSIIGNASLCAGNIVTFTNATSGGTWSSTNTSIATIGTGSGIVTGVSAGTSTISYRLSGGCIAARVLTVNLAPSPISGTATLCTSTTTTLTNATAGGTWVSGNMAIATVATASGVVTGVAAGTAIVSYSLAGGCTATTVVTVNGVPAITVAGVSSVCVGSATTLSSGVTGGIWYSTNTGIATVSSAGVVWGVAAGTVPIVYTAYNSCGIGIGSMYVHVGTPSPLAGVTTVCAGSVVTLSHVTPGGTWSSGTVGVATVGSASGVVSGVGVGTAVVSYTLPCGVVTATVTVTASPGAGSIAGITTVCTGATTSLSSTVGGGTWSSVSTGVATITSTGIVTGVSAGTSVISYTVSGSCGTALATATINVVNSPSAGTIMGTTTLCAGTTTTFNNTVGGGTWSFASTGVATIHSSGAVTGVSAGTSVISYTVGGSCGTAVATTTIAVLPLPVAGSLSGPSLVATGDSIVLSASVGGGTWSSSSAHATVSGGVVGGVSAGTAIISYVVTNSCGTAAATKTITINAPALGSISGPSSLCAGATGTYSHTTIGGVWASSFTSRATIGSSSGIVSGVSAGTATISYTVGGVTVTTTLTVLPVPAVINGTAVVCVGNITTLSTTSTGGSWVSDDPSIATASTTAYGIVGGVSGGTTTISYVFGSGCASARTFTVSNSPLGIMGASTLCFTQTATLSNTASGGTWSSSHPTIASVEATTGIIRAFSTASNATITYAMPGGCSATATVAVVNMSTAVSGTTSVCAGQTTVFSHGTAGGVWSSSDATVATIGTGSGTVNGVSAGTATISYTMNATCMQTRVVTVNAAPSAISGAGGLCIAETLSLTNAVGGGTWASSATSRASVNASTGIVAGISAGTALISYSIGSCRATVSVTVGAVPSAISGATTICAGNTTTLGATPTGGTWSSSDLSVATNSGSVLYGVSSGTSVISYTTSGGCARTATVSVSDAPSPILGASNLCLSQSITLSNATPGGVWSRSGSTAAVIGSATGIVTASGSVTGSPAIRYTMPGGCFASTTVTVVNPVTAFSGTHNVCERRQVMLAHTAVGGTWTSSNTSVATVGTGAGLVNGVSAGTTIISYAFNASCAHEGYFTVKQSPALFTGTVSLCRGATITLTNAVAGGTWASANTLIATVHSSSGLVGGVVTATGFVKISYALSNGCKDSALVSVASCAKEEVMDEFGVANTATLRVTPNPSAGTFTISGQLATTDDESLTIEVTNMLGQVVYSGNTWAKEGVINSQVQLGKNIANGMYLLAVKSPREVRVFHIVVEQ